MASMNWLGFSLYPQQLASSSSQHNNNNNNDEAVEHSHHQTVATTTTTTSLGGGFNSEEVGAISATDDAVSGECFDLMTSSHSTTVHHSSLNLIPSSFGIFTTPHQDWSTKGNYNRQTLLLGTSCNGDQNLNNYHQPQPKLENFLGQHSFGENNHQDHHTFGGNSASSGGGLMFPSCSLQLPATEMLPEEKLVAGGGSSSIPKNTNSIGLSMIKSWLRNQPPHQKSSSSSDAAVTAAAASISLSMGAVSQSTSSVALPLLRGNDNNVDGESSSSDNNNNINNKQHQQQQNTITTVEGQDSAVPNNRKAIDTFGQRTSIYRGVTRHRWTGRYEAHLWDNSCRREGQTRKGRQVYLGGYDKEEKAARAYDLAALKYWGTTTTTNFPISNYEKELEEMKHMTRQEYIASLRRKSSGFSRGASIYRGVTRHHQHGRWQARIGRVAGNKDLYLGTFSTQEEAAEAYDIAAIKFRGLNAVTNFEMSRYDVKNILESTSLPIGSASSAAKRLKDSNNVEQIELSVETLQKSSSEDHINMSSHLSYGAINWPNNSIPFQHQQQQQHLQHYGQILNNNYPYGGNHHDQKFWCKQEVQDHVDASHQSYENIHHQLQLGNTHNFFHQSNNSGVHSFMSIDRHHDSASIDNNNSSASSNPVIYGDGGYMIPIGNDGNNQNHPTGNTFLGGGDNEMKLLNGYENLMINYSADPYNARYYLSQQSSSSEAVHAIKGSDQFDACNSTTWVPTAIPTLAAATRTNNNMALCTGAQPFTLLHE